MANYPYDANGATVLMGMHMGVMLDHATQPWPDVRNYWTNMCTPMFCVDVLTRKHTHIMFDTPPQYMCVICATTTMMDVSMFN